MGMASAGLSAGLGIYGAIKGAKEQRDAERAMKNYQRQELNNVYENAQVSTLGADLQREEQARLASSQVNALKGGGTRALVSGLGRVETGNQMVNQKVGANLDEQQKAIDQMTAEDQARIRSMQEARENADINALSSQYQSGKQDMNMGLGNIVQGFGSMGNQMNFNKWLDLQKQSLNQGITNQNITPSNPLSTGVMTRTGGSGMNAVNDMNVDVYGNRITQPVTNSFNPRRIRPELGYTVNYDGTLNFNN